MTKVTTGQNDKLTKDLPTHCQLMAVAALPVQLNTIKSCFAAVIVLAGLFVAYLSLSCVPSKYGNTFTRKDHSRTHSISQSIVDSRLPLLPKNVKATTIVGDSNTVKWHIVTNFFVVTHSAFNKDLASLESNASINDVKQLQQRLILRLNELKSTQQRNLNHPDIEGVHVIYSHPHTKDFLSQIKFNNSYKLVYHMVNGEPTYQHAFAYAFNYLPGKFVCVTNQDIYFGDGWSEINYTILKRNRLMYALTRYPGNTSCVDQFTCEYDKQYVGSHDTFAFFANTTVNATSLDMMNLKSDSLGIENVLIWLFKYKLGYLVLNPCRILKTYHFHCSAVHNKNRTRVNTQLTTAFAEFTSRLS